MEDIDWHASNSQALALELRQAIETGEHWFLILNASSYKITCHVPELDVGLIWRVKVDTACSTGELIGQQHYVKDSVQLDARSLMLLKCVRRLD
jgi:glycogen operon protein